MKKKTVLILLAVMLLVALGVAAFFARIFYADRARNTFVGCTSNLKNIATALEMYSTDNLGLYPKQLSQIVPKYLKLIPECPSAGEDTYSSTYTSAAKPDAFTLYCQGHHHEHVNIPQDHPAYSSYQGLMDR